MRTLRLPLIAGFLLLAACTATTPITNTVACTMEAKVCPDGSYVGREGPKCEFAQCPGGTASGASLHSVSDGTITFSYDTNQFGLAVTDEQIPASYIPACEEGFAYCVYATDSQYAETNFESAGIGIVKRTDIVGSTDCLNKQPTGYQNLKPVVRQGDEYATSVFAPLGDAGAGHAANDRLYRLSFGTSCYEFRTRIGKSQFANYEPGTITEFTAADEAALQTELDSVLAGITTMSGQHILFP